VRIVAALVVAALTMWVAVHLLNAEVSKNNPPVACLLDGGTWNLWSGWSCLLPGR
jgi:hypothetical protein